MRVSWCRTVLELVLCYTSDSRRKRIETRNATAREKGGSAEASATLAAITSYSVWKLLKEKLLALAPNPISLGI